jgi:hypothetical protein
LDRDVADRDHRQDCAVYNLGGFDDHLQFTAAPATQRTLPPESFKDSHDQAAEHAYRDRIRDLHQETPIGKPIP